MVLTMLHLIFTLLSFHLASHAEEGRFCKKWSEIKHEGVLEKKDVAEASGVAASLKFPDRIYWINDSGNEPAIFYSKVNGKNMKKIKLVDASFRDTESMAITMCGEEPCLIIGDTGNNAGKPREPQLNIFYEKDLTKDKAKPFRKVKFNYPDGTHDVEAMAALPDGDLIFITKEVSLLGEPEAKVFALSKSNWLEGTGDLTARAFGRFPTGKWLPDKGFLGTAVTDAAVNTQRNVLGILTYSALIEIPLEKLTKSETEFALVPIKNLNQQEAMTYLPKKDVVVWTSEFFPPKTPIYSIECERTTEY